MPPLYGEEQTNQNQQPSLQTHSNKFPIEREVVISSTDKNTKIPILHEYKRTTGRVAIAPDAPVKQQAWVQEGNQAQERQEGHARNFQPPEIHSSTSTGAVPRTPKPEEDRTKSLSKTYHTIKDMISSRFGPSRKDTDPDPEVSLNNVTEELRKSSHNIDEDDSKKKEIAYSKPRADPPPINIQHYPKNTYQQYGHPYYQSTQQNVASQLQSAPQIQPSLPGQSAQLHVTHLTPPAGVQTVHQTQVSAYNQPVPPRGDYVVQGPSGHPIHQHQNIPLGKHGLPMQPVSSNSTYQSPQQLLHQSQLHQNSRFNQQHVQNMHQRQLIQQMQQQQQQLVVGQQSPRTNMRTQQQFPSGVSYQQYQQARQTISRSQIDLPSTSRQGLDVRIGGQEVYYHYNQNRPRFPGTPQVYMKPDNDVEFQRQSSTRCIEKATSQPQLCYDDERNLDRRLDKNEESKSNDGLLSEKYEITVEDRCQEFTRSDSQRNDEFRPETSFGNRKDDARTSKKESDVSHGEEVTKDSAVQKKIAEIQRRGESKDCSETDNSRGGAKNGGQVNEAAKRIEESNRRLEMSYQGKEGIREGGRKEEMDHSMARLKIQNQGSGSDYDKAGQSSSNVDSGRGSAVYSSGRRPPPEDQSHPQGQDSEWVDIVESELRSILEPRDVPAMAHSTLSESVSSVTPPLPPLSPHGSPRTPRNRYSTSLPYGSKPNYGDYGKGQEKRNFQGSTKHRGASTSKKDAPKKFTHLFGVEAGDLTSTTTGLDLDSMLDRSDSDLSTNDARTIRKQLEGLENMYSEVLKLLGGSVKKRRKARGLTSYGSVSSLPTSSVSSRPVARHHDKRRAHVIDDRMKKAKDIKSINKRFQRLESHVVTLARSVAHLSSEMRTQHLMIQEMENIRGEISALRTQTSMAMVRSQSQPLLKDSELPALSNPSRVKKLTKFFGTEPPLIRLFLRELGYEKYAAAFEKEKVGMVELPYLSEERLQKMGIPLGPRLRILQEARISVCKDPIYVV
uniref:SAM domain-containing protein n=2 Tax=Fopius arisanus TaxID=64838 RepID=A0A0C9QMX8_9HYME